MSTVFTAFFNYRRSIYRRCGSWRWRFSRCIAFSFFRFGLISAFLFFFTTKTSFFFYAIFFFFLCFTACFMSG